jgi:hypothetical protein
VSHFGANRQSIMADAASIAPAQKFVLLEETLQAARLAALAAKLFWT